MPEYLDYIENMDLDLSKEVRQNEEEKKDNDERRDDEYYDNIR